MHENNHSSSRKNDDDPSNFSIFLQGLDYSKMGLERRNFQGRKKRAEKFNKNAQKRQISMKELRYAQKLLKGKRFWPYFQHLDFFSFPWFLWYMLKMQIQKWHKDFYFFCKTWREKWWNENAVLQQQFTGNKSVWVLSEVQLYTPCYP